MVTADKKDAKRTPLSVRVLLLCRWLSKRSLRFRILFLVVSLLIIRHYVWYKYFWPEGTFSQYQVWKRTRPEPITRSRNDGSLFVPYIFSTTKSPRKADWGVRAAVTSCIRLNPNYKYMIYDDAECLEIVRHQFPEFLDLYLSTDIISPVMRTDMWRYMMLYAYGGVYVDSDVQCIKPIDQWGDVFRKDGETTTPRLDALIGVEILSTPSKGEIQFCQWTMAAAQPRHPLFYRTLELINETVASIRAGIAPRKDAVYVTGPAVFSRAVNETLTAEGYTADDFQLSSPSNRNILTKNHIGILNVNGFGPFQWHSNSTHDLSNPEICVRHYFRGRWKPYKFYEKAYKKFKLYSFLT